MSPPRPTRQPRPRGNRGFALLITITLLAFLVLRNSTNMGYAVHRGANGLVQEEGRPPIATTGPAFRILTRALFMWGEDRNSGSSSQGRDRWLALRNPRAFMMTGMPYWDASQNQEKQGASGTTSGRPPLDGPATSWPDGVVPKAGTTQVSSGTRLDDGLANNTTLFEFRPASPPCFPSDNFNTRRLIAALVECPLFV